MTLSEKIKTIDNKIEQNKAQYNLGRQTAKISEMLVNMNFWHVKMFQQKNNHYKKLLQSKDLNILYYGLS